MIDISTFIEEQLAKWPMAKDNFEALKDVKVKQVGDAKVQFNPARIVSTGAKVDAASLKKRACFLCDKNRPPEQFGIDWKDYTILINPFPIFPKHLTIPAKKHTPQRIKGRIADMCALAKELKGYVVFYNGPKCGASAPDHMHFQAGNADFLPDSIPAAIGSIEIEETTPQKAEAAFNAIYDAMPAVGEEEPMMNILCRYVGRKYRLTIIPRKKHRPSFYGDGPGKMLISPASVDLGGVIITPREKDFKAIDEKVLSKVFSELCFTMPELANAIEMRQTIKVGIMSAQKIDMILKGDYLLDGDVVTGSVNLEARHVKSPMLFVPLQNKCLAEVKDVTIGVDFHWQRKEDQKFMGRMMIVPDDEQLTLINIVPIEDYLRSVISSEMSATSQIELLKAHAVISRSWVLAQIEQKAENADVETVHGYDNHNQHIRWYGGNDHKIFDVCADDHCQRYQGVTRQTTNAVNEAVRATEGEVLVFDGKLCDARFSKCCGGAFEQFENCWEEDHKPYLIGKLDWTEGELPDLSDENNACEWILSAPKAFCNTMDKEVLSQVLNGYDQETADFYRWTVDYDDDTISKLIAKKTGYDFGKIIDMVPVKRGTSGRIVILKIIGEKMTLEIGKELEIRRILSESHLYSSAFVVEKTNKGFRLHGAGWGHGVGLCQIGAATMAAKGYDYRQILAHYYPGAEIVKR